MPKEKHHTKIVECENGLSKLVIVNHVAQAEIYLHGGHLTHFQLHGQPPLIFDAQESRVTPPHSVHAGIPICWPWFGVHPTDSTKPQHGFARDSVWSLKSTTQPSDSETEVVLTLRDDPKSHLLFDFAFELELRFNIAERLSITLTSTNRDDDSFSITQALHTYFSVSDLDHVSIEGLEGTPFIDYTDEKQKKREYQPLEISEELNRVYIPTSASCTIKDRGLQREILVQKRGSNSTTVWNPWRESGIHDLPDEKYREFVCIETTNALDDIKVLQPGTSTSITQIISTHSL